MKKIYALSFIIIVAIFSCPMLFAEGEKFEPVSKEKLDRFYAKDDRHVIVNVHESSKLHNIPKGFLGINMSYFNTTDDMWDKYDLLDKLKKSGVGAMRYPGGEETSFFHWKYPGVNGYEDIWDSKEEHGTSTGRGRFQVTWVSPDKWAFNQDFLNFDEFMEKCIAIDAEPIVGINLSSGKKHDRQADGIKEALELMRYCKTKNYTVKYWFLDNEPWHHEGHYQFNNQQYIEEVKSYGAAIKSEFPDARLIANPTSSTSYNWWQGLEEFVKDTGKYIDFIDVHWYWAWGQGSFDLWRNQQPLTTGDKWKKKEWDRPFADDIRMIKETIAKAGHPEIGLVVLEWNIAPSNWTQTFNQSLIAIIQAELLMEFANGNVEHTCLWPFIWQTSRDVWSEQDFFPSIVTQSPPFKPTLSLEMFRMFSFVQNTTILQSNITQKDLPVLITQSSEGSKHILLINKNPLRRKIIINFDNKLSSNATAEMIALKSQVIRTCPVERIDQDSICMYAEPFSFISATIPE